MTEQAPQRAVPEAAHCESCNGWVIHGSNDGTGEYQCPGVRATPAPLDVALSILRANHGSIGDDPELDAAIHHLSHSIAIRKLENINGTT